MPGERLICDGCGRAADQEHIARRLKRLENMTRYRPVHVQALFIEAVTPDADTDYLYSAESAFGGQGAELLGALRIDSAGRTVEATLAEFQRRGYVLAHLMECPGAWPEAAAGEAAIEGRIGATMTRIRRSFKPKRIILVGEELARFVATFQEASLGAELVVGEAGGACRLRELWTVCNVTTVTSTGVPAV